MESSMRLLAFSSCLFIACVATVRGQNQQIVLGPTADYALNQPYVNFSMSNGTSTLGPSTSNQVFLLDTAATSIVAVSRAAADLNRSAGNFNTGVFEELGVGGTIDYFVSEPYRMHIAGDNGSIQIDDTKILSDANQSFGQPELGFEPFVGIAGQPAMVNRVTTFDFVPNTSGGILDPFNLSLSALSSVEMNVLFGSDVPQGNGHRYTIPVTAEHFEPEGNVTPTAAPLAMVEVTQRLGCEQSTGRYAFDTGAQLSIMDTRKLAEMGLTAADATSSVEVQGVGGTRSVPVFSLEEFRIQTNEGVDLVYREPDGSAGIQVIGLDLPQIDGVIGADILSQDGIDPNDLGNLLALLLGGGLGTPDNPIDEVHLDFRNLQKPDQSGTGTLYFDLKSQFDNITESDRIHLADGNADGKVDDADRQIWQAHNGQSGTRCSTGDFNRDGRTDAADLVIWEAGINGIDPTEPNCDFNGDSVCDAHDVDRLLDALGSTNQPAFDLDTSSPEITLLDRDAWLTIAGNKESGSPFLLGDLNFDGTVDPVDLNALGQNWTKDANVGYADGDIDGDDLVGPSDLNQIGQNWLRTSQPLANAAVPEPASCWLLLGALLGVRWIRTK